MSRWQADLKALNASTGLEFSRDLGTRAGEAFLYDRNGLHIEVVKHDQPGTPGAFTATVHVEPKITHIASETAADAAVSIGEEVRSAISQTATAVGLDVFPSSSLNERSPAIPKLVGIALSRRDAKIAVRLIKYAAHRMDHLKLDDLRRTAWIIQAIELAVKTG